MSNDDAWIRQVYALGAKGSFDALTTHPYQGIADAPPERPDGNRWWFTHLPAVRDVMLEYGDGDKPIWFTELGWSAHANWSGAPNWQRGVTAEQQASYFVRALEYTPAQLPLRARDVLVQGAVEPVRLRRAPRGLRVARRESRRASGPRALSAYLG